MNKYLQKAIEKTGCDKAEIICSTDNGTWNLIVCTYTDDDGYCHCWLLRIWEVMDEINFSVDYENVTKTENADTQMFELGKAIANWIPNFGL